ncbi:MAG: ComEC/Rec2 family competence protein, partial [Myxococcota bacterium]|nr:ComEC/Rec2 family competence protein [Myxococcota bacterium]
MAVAAIALGGALPGRWRCAAALALAWAAGALSLALQLAAGALTLEGEHVIEGRVRTLLHWPGRWSAELDRLVVAGRPTPARVRLVGEATPEGLPAFEAALPGQRIRARVRLRPSRPLRNPGAPDRERADRRGGIAAVGRLVHPALHARLPARDRWRWLAPLHRLRERIAERLSASGDGGALLRALAVGDARALPADARDAFARLGIAHLLAVSGLHLALAAALAYAALRHGPARSAWLAARGDVRRGCVLGALLAAAGYALLAGWGIPVRRALVLVLALALGFLAGRARSRTEPLAAAVIVILAAEPQALFAAGAQLSFAATAALLAAARRPGEPPGGRLEGLLRSSATAFAATAPLAALHLGSRAPFALVANLLAVPWTGAVLLPAALLSAAAAGLDAGAALLEAGELVAGSSLRLVARVATVVPGAVDAPAPAR